MSSSPRRVGPILPISTATLAFTSAKEAARRPMSRSADIAVGEFPTLARVHHPTGGLAASAAPHHANLAVLDSYRPQNHTS